MERLSLTPVTVEKKKLSRDEKKAFVEEWLKEYVQQSWSWEFLTVEQQMDFIDLVRNYRCVFSDYKSSLRLQLPVLYTMFLKGADVV